MDTLTILNELPEGTLVQGFAGAGFRKARGELFCKTKSVGGYRGRYLTTGDMVRHFGPIYIDSNYVLELNKPKELELKDNFGAMAIVEINGKRWLAKNRQAHEFGGNHWYTWILDPNTQAVEYRNSRNLGVGDDYGRLTFDEVSEHLIEVISEGHNPPTPEGPELPSTPGSVATFSYTDGRDDPGHIYYAVLDDLTANGEKNHIWNFGGNFIELPVTYDDLDQLGITIEDIFYDAEGHSKEAKS